MPKLKMPDEVFIEDARFVYKPNFEGRAETYNDEGHRYFNVEIPGADKAAAMEADGWNVKWTKGNDDYPSIPYMEITVGFKYRKPEIVLIQDGKKTPIVEATVDLMDSTEFESFDVGIRPYVYDINGNTGVKAYLKTFYGTVPFDPIRAKYANLD